MRFQFRGESETRESTRTCVARSKSKPLGFNSLEAALVLAIVGLGTVASGQERVTLRLKWNHQFQFAGYYAALEKGYYAEAGLDVRILEDDGVEQVDEVVAGKADYAVEGPDLLLRRADGSRVVVLAAIFQHSAEALAVRQDSGIQGPHELLGPPIALPVGNAAVRAMLKKEGVREESLNVVASTRDLADLEQGRVVARAIYVTDAPFELARRGVRFRLIQPRTYGVDFYGDCLFTSERELRDHPDRVRRFRAASLRGWEYAMSHPQELIGVIRFKYKSRMSQEALDAEASAMRELILPGLVEMGHMNPGRWRHIADTYADVGMLPAAYPVEGFLYDPENALTRGLWRYAAGLAIFGITSAGLLALFNRRLRATVRERTAELHAINEQMRAIFDTSVELIGALKPDGTLIEANRTSLSLVGARLEDVVGKPFWDTPWWSHSKAAQEEVRHAIAEALEGRVRPHQAEHPGVDGAMHLVEFIVHPIRDESGRVILLVPEGRDVTERVRYEKALRESEEKFSRAFHASPLGILLSRLSDGRIVEANSAWLAVTGLTREQCIGRTSVEVGIWSDADERERFVSAEQLRAGAFRNIERRRRLRSGRDIAVLASAELVEIAGESVVLTTVADVTEQRRLESAQAELQRSLLLSAAEWRRTFDAIDSPILIADGSGVVRRLNRAASNLIGADFNEVIGVKVGDLGPGEPWVTAGELVADALRDDAARDRGAVDDRNGKRFEIFVRVAGTGPDDADSRVILRIRDVTAIAALQESLARAAKMSAVGSLVAGVAHEVRNPLFSISATLDTLHTDLKDDPAFAECWPVLQTQVSRLTRLMRDLLDYGRPTTPRKGAVNVADVIRRSVDSCEALAGEAGVRVELALPEGLPEIHADAGRIEQVFENLVSNAIQHSPRGGSVRVSAAGEREGSREYVRCVVDDDGPGIPEADIPRLFEPFFTRRKGGTGLGLPISHSIVEEHGGTLAGETRPEGGARLVVRLPVVAAEQAGKDTRV